MLRSFNEREGECSRARVRASVCIRVCVCVGGGVYRFFSLLNRMYVLLLFKIN